MKEKSFLALFLATAILVSSCNNTKEADTDDKVKVDDSTAVEDMAVYKAVPQDALKAFVDGLNNIKSLGKAEVESFSTKDGSITEARIRVKKQDGSMISFAVTDLGVDTFIYRSHLSGKLISQGTEGLVFKDKTPDIKAYAGIKLDQSTGFGALDFYNAATDATRTTIQSNLTFPQITEAIQATDAKGGDFVAPLRADIPDLAGWVIYDAKSKIGFMNLGYADRFAIILNGTNISQVSELNKLLSTIDFSPLKELNKKFLQNT